MSPDVAQTIQAIAITVVSLIATAAVPWCIKIERRLSHIESGLTQQMATMQGEVHDMHTRLRSIELEHAQYHPHCQPKRPTES